MMFLLLCFCRCVLAMSMISVIGMLTYRSFMSKVMAVAECKFG